MNSKTIEIDANYCLEVSLFLTRNEDKEDHVLIQAWHYFENQWFYRFDTFYADYRSLLENYIEDFSLNAAVCFAQEFEITKNK